MPIALDVNPAYDEWKSSTGQEKEWALNTLLGRMNRMASAICYQRLPEHSSELDGLVNGIVWRAFNNIDKFKGESKFGTWFYRIVVNECNRYLRRYKRRCEVGLEEDTHAITEAPSVAVDTIAQLDNLTAPEHQLFRLVSEGHDFKTIAEALGVPRRSIAFQRWARLRAKLKNAV